MHHDCGHKQLFQHREPLVDLVFERWHRNSRAVGNGSGGWTSRHWRPCRRKHVAPPPHGRSNDLHVILMLELQSTVDYGEQRGELRTTLEERFEALHAALRAEGKAQGLERGLERGRALLVRQVARLLAGIGNPGRLQEVGEWIVDCDSGSGLLVRLEGTG